MRIRDYPQNDGRARLLNDLHLEDAGYSGQRVLDQAYPRYTGAVGCDQKVGGAAHDLLHERQAPATGALVIGWRPHVPDFVADEGHRQVDEVRDDNLARFPWCARTSVLTTKLDVEMIRIQMHPCMSIAFGGNESQFLTSVSVKDLNEEDLLDGPPLQCR